MTAVTLEDARQSLGDLMTEVWKSHDPVLITSDSIRPVVLIPLDDYAPAGEMDADTWLRRSPANVMKLNESIAQLRSGNVVVKTMEELEAMEEA